MVVKRRRRWRRWALLTALLLGLISVLTLILHRRIIGWLAPPWIVEAVSDALGLETTLEEFDAGLDGRIRLRCLAASAAEPQTAVTGLVLPLVEADVSVPDTLLGRPGAVREIRGYGLRVSLDLDRPWPKSEGDDAVLRMLVPLPRVSLRNCQLELRSARSSYRLAGADLQVAEGRFSIEARELIAAGTILDDRLGQPLSIRGHLADAARPLRGLVLEEFRLGKRDLIDEATLKPDESGIDSSLGLARSAGWVRARLDRDQLELSLETEGPAFADLLTWIAGAPPLEGEVSAKLHAKVPLASPADATLDGSVSLTRPAIGGTPIAEQVELAIVQVSPRMHRVRFHVDTRPEAERGRRIGAIHADGELTIDHSRDDTVRFSLEHTRAGRAASGELVEGDGDVMDLGGEFDTASQLARLDVAGGSAVLAPWLDLIAPHVPRSGRELLSSLAPSSLRGALSFRGRVDPRDFRRHEETWEVDSELHWRTPCAVALLGEAGDELPDAALGAGAEGLATARLHDGVLEVDALQLRAEGLQVDLEGIADLADYPDAVLFAEFTGAAAGLAFDSSGPLVLQVSRDGLRVEPLALTIAGGRVELASVDEPPRLRLSAHEVKLEDLPVAALHRRGLGGRLDLDVEIPAARLKGRAEDAAPRIASVEVRVRDGRLEVDGRSLDGFTATTSFDVHGAADLPHALRIHELEIRRGADFTRASGTLSIARQGEGDERSLLERTTADLELAAGVAELASWLSPGRALRELGGSVSVEAQLRDRLVRPRVTARLTLEDVHARLPGEIGSFSNARGRIRLDGDRVELLPGLGVDYRGSRWGMEGETRLRLDELAALPASETQSAWPPFLRRVDVRVAGKRVNLVPGRGADDIRARGDVDLRISGEPDDLLVSGSVNVDRALFLRNVRLLPERNPLPFDFFSIQTPPLDRMRFDVSIRSDRGLHVRNNVAEGRASLDLVLKGTGERPFLVGRIFADRGRARLPSTMALKIESAIVEFLEKQPYNPRIDARLTSRIRGHDITVTVGGDFERPEVYLDSLPPLERERVLVLLTTGYTVEEIDSRGTERVAVLQAARYVGYLIAQQFSSGEPDDDSFLGRFSLEMEGARTLDGEDLIRVEYRLSDHLFLQTERDHYGDYNVNVGVKVETK